MNIHQTTTHPSVEAAKMNEYLLSRVAALAYNYARAAVLLSQLAPVQPVPVGERLPGDALCWWFTPEGGEEYGWWVLEPHGMEREPQPTHWLPIDALPQPSQSEAGS